MTNIKFINFNGIQEYARVMYNDVKDADKYRIDVAYNGRDIKDLLEYLFNLEQEIERLKIIEEKYKDSQLYVKDFKDEIERLQKELDKTRLSELDKEYKLNQVREYAGELRLYDNESIEFEISTKFLEILKGE